MKDLNKKLKSLSAKQRALLEKKLQQTQDDIDNTTFVTTSTDVEKLLAHFYGKYPWPWQPARFEFLLDTDFETTMLNQDIGAWKQQTIPKDAQIWVAGCGTNQAIITALRFPEACVIGSDLSERSLQLAQDTAQQLSISNLKLKQESINDVLYKKQFHYIICTGVIHHNANPQHTLNQLSQALIDDGVLELMVYNRHHRLVTSAFQKAIRIFSGGTCDFDMQLTVAKKIVADPEIKIGLKKAFVQFMEWSEADIADLLIQPVEHSYTVETLADLAKQCGLQLSVPCISLYAKFLARVSWEMHFEDIELNQKYWQLGDLERWQMTNLLLHERSPLLWFYLRRENNNRSYIEQCKAMLDVSFKKCQSTQQFYIREQQKYSLSKNQRKYPAVAPDDCVKEIFAAIDPSLSLRQILEKLQITVTLEVLHKIRVYLTSSAFPYVQKRL